MARRILDALTTAVQALGDQDRVILRLRFQDGLAVADIARALHLDQKPLYRRFDALLNQLRAALEAAGIDRTEASEIVNRKDVDISLALLGGPPEADSSRPTFRARVAHKADHHGVDISPGERRDAIEGGCLDAELLASYIDGRTTPEERVESRGAPRAVRGLLLRVLGDRAGAEGRGDGVGGIRASESLGADGCRGPPRASLPRRPWSLRCRCLARSLPRAVACRTSIG